MPSRYQLSRDWTFNLFLRLLGYSSDFPFKAERRFKVTGVHSQLFLCLQSRRQWGEARIEAKVYDFVGGRVGCRVGGGAGENSGQGIREPSRNNKITPQTVTAEESANSGVHKTREMAKTLMLVLGWWAPDRRCSSDMYKAEKHHRAWRSFPRDIYSCKNFGMLKLAVNPQKFPCISGSKDSAKKPWVGFTLAEGLVFKDQQYFTFFAKLPSLTVGKCFLCHLRCSGLLWTVCF